MLTDVISTLGGITLTVTRTAAGTTDNFGRYVPGATSTFPIVAGVVPGGSDLDVEAEGFSAEDVRTIFTTTKLVKLPTPDRVTIDSEDFAVYSVTGPWTGFGGVHWVCKVARVASPGGY